MSKPNLVLIGWTDLSSSYLDRILQEHFNFKNFQLDSTYDPQQDILVFSLPEYTDKETLLKYLDQGFRLIMVNLWEARPFYFAKEFEPYLDNILLVLGCLNPDSCGWKNIVSVPNWFWYNEHLWYTSSNIYQHQNYIPNRTNSRLFLMPIKRQRNFRTYIVNRFDKILDQSIYSYIGNKGPELKTKEDNPLSKVAWDRQFEPEWYNDTYFSVVVETFVSRLDMDKEMRGEIDDASGPCELFITEKTFKPIALQHPFMILGMKNILGYLKQLGFETFNHIFDESYDSLDLFEDRVEIVYNNIVTFNKEKYLDSLTEQKIQHNYNLFYNRSKVVDGINKDIIEPLLEWINAT